MSKTLEQQMYDGDLARQIIENPVYEQVMGEIEKELIDTWKSAENPADRESLHKYLKTLQLFKTRLDVTFGQGKLAKLEIERKRSLLEKVGIKQRFEWF